VDFWAEYVFGFTLQDSDSRSEGRCNGCSYCSLARRRFCLWIQNQDV